MSRAALGTGCKAQPRDRAPGRRRRKASEDAPDTPHAAGSPGASSTGRLDGCRTYEPKNIFCTETNLFAPHARGRRSFNTLRGIGSEQNGHTAGRLSAVHSMVNEVPHAPHTPRNTCTMYSVTGPTSLSSSPSPYTFHHQLVLPFLDPHPMSQTSHRPVPR